jgi:ribonuclease H / adenosylcobalamin/alpha-ribazole phosphatase
VNTLIVARHGEALSNVDGTVNGRPPGVQLSDAGRRQAEELGAQLRPAQIELGVCSRFLRARETLRIALAGRSPLPVVVTLELDEIDFGSFEGGSLETYREWAWTAGPAAACPGGGESRAAAAERIAMGLDALLARPERTILAVGHALPLRYVLDAADGRCPAARLERIAHATPYPLERDEVETAAETLRVWAREPQFRDAAA